MSTSAHGPERLAPRDLALLVSVALLWGFNFVPIKWALAELPPFTLASLRFALAALPAVFFVARPKMPWRLIAVYGVTIGVGQFGLLFLGISLGMPAGLASLVAQVQIFFTIALGAALLGDRVRPRHVAGGLAAAAGLAVLAVPQLGGHGSIPVAAFALVVAAAACWAGANIVATSAGRRYAPDMFALVVWSSLVSPIPLAVLSFALEGGFEPMRQLAHVSVKAWGSVAFISYGATLFGFATWNRMLHRYPTTVVSPFALLIPVAGLASGVLVLGELLAVSEIVGASIVLIGLAVALWSSPSALPAMEKRREPAVPGPEDV